MGLYGDGNETGWTPVFIVRRFSEALAESGKFFAVIVSRWFWADF